MLKLDSPSEFKLQLLLSLISTIAVVVPRCQRTDWKQEWQAEIIFHWRQLHQRHRFNRKRHFKALNYCSGAVVDALVLRAESSGLVEWVGDFAQGMAAVIRYPRTALVSSGMLSAGISCLMVGLAVVGAGFWLPLPMAQVDSLVVVNNTCSVIESKKLPFSVSEFYDLQHSVTSLQAIEALHPSLANVSFTHTSVAVKLGRVSDGFLSLTSGGAALGTCHWPAEPNSSQSLPGVVISHRFWKQYFDATPDILGTQIEVDQKPYQIQGVMPAGFDLPGQINVWIQLTSPANLGSQTERDTRFLTVFGRLQPGMTVNEVQQELDMLARKLKPTPPVTDVQWPVWGMTVKSVRQWWLGDWYTTILWLFAGTVGVFGLAVWATIRTEGRQPVETDFATNSRQRFRWSLGEGWGLITLGMIGGGLAGIWYLKLVNHVFLQPVLQVEPARLDGWVWATTCVVLMLMVIIRSFRASQSLVSAEIISPTWPKRAFQSVAVTLFLGLAVVAGMYQITLEKHQKVGGHDVRDWFTFQVRLPGVNPKDPAVVEQFLNETTQRIRSLDGVTAVCASSRFPFGPRKADWSIEIEGYRPERTGKFPTHGVSAVSPGYFAAFQSRILLGRDFTAEDRSNSERVVIINRAVADAYWPGENPLGHRLNLNPGDPRGWRTIIGVVENTLLPGTDDQVLPEVYCPIVQFPPPILTFLVLNRKGTPLPMLDQRSEPQPAIRVFHLSSLNQRMTELLSRQRFALQSLLAMIVAVMAIVVGHSDPTRSIQAASSQKK
ncbi:MAG: ABC transporter permease [Acidobacteria bacterium]|nr:ABC transporter permease [Acidobacteriota bacterium]